MNVIRMQIYQLSTVLSEQNDFFNSAIQIQKEIKGKISEGEIKAVLKLLFKTGICKCSLSQ